MELAKIICALIFPPVAAYLQVGFGIHFWINIICTILGIIPGIVHAIWIIVKGKK